MGKRNGKDGRWALREEVRERESKRVEKICEEGGGPRAEGQRSQR